MNKAKEIPLFSSKLLYFDECYDRRTSEAIVSVLQNNGFFPPSYINVDKLTRGRYRRFRPEMEQWISDGYTGKNILFIGLTDAADLHAQEFWKMEWMLTFNKFSKHTNVPAYRPWNVLAYSISYDRLRQPQFYERYFQCVQESIQVLCPFYARMDDVSMAVNLNEMRNRNIVLPEQYGRVNSVHWGNYFGKEYCEKYMLTAKTPLPVETIEELGEGVLFKLTSSALDYSSKSCMQKRKEIKKMLELDKEI